MHVISIAPLASVVTEVHHNTSSKTSNRSMLNFTDKAEAKCTPIQHVEANASVISAAIGDEHIVGDASVDGGFCHSR